MLKYIDAIHKSHPHREINEVAVTLAHEAAIAGIKETTNAAYGVIEKAKTRYT